MKKETKKKIIGWIIKLSIFAAAIVIFIILNKIFGISTYINNFLKIVLERIKGTGFWAPVIFIVLYILCTVLFIPGSILTLGSGFLFGIIQGTIYVSIGSTAGACLAFLISRYFARKWIEKKIEGNEKFTAIDTAVGKEGWKIVGLTRLSPVFPFNLLNYAYGLTKVKFIEYFIASWIGMLPGTIMYVYIGSLAKDLATIGSSEATLGIWILRIVGFAATVIVTTLVTIIARKALKKKIPEKEKTKIEV